MALASGSVMAIVHDAVAPSAATGAAATVAIAAAVVGAAWPASLAPALALLALVAGFSAAAAHLSGAALLAAVTGEAAALWTVHSAYALAATVPLDAVVDRRLLTRFAGRLGGVLALAVPLVVVTLLVAAVAPTSDVVRAVGVLAAAGACAVPVYLLRRSP